LAKLEFSTDDKLATFKPKGVLKADEQRMAAHTGTWPYAKQRRLCQHLGGKTLQNLETETSYFQSAIYLQLQLLFTGLKH
jgi:hypothetical protein